MPIRRRIINAYTLEVFDTLRAAAKHYGVSSPSICNSVGMGFKIKGQVLVDFKEWLQWPKEKKELYSKRCNIYFL